MKVRVGKRNEPGAIYVGRPSPLGNPFNLVGGGPPAQQARDREKVCDEYEVWFNIQVRKKDPRVMRELNRLLDLARGGEVVLGCYCAPRRCHADTIKRWLDQQLAAEGRI